MKTFLKATIIFILFVFPFSALSQDNDPPPLHPCPDWVHPGMRNKYPGYDAKKKRKQDSPMWKYSTNRPGGNIRGGGTVEYNDYQPFFNPDQKKSDNTR
ncbi:MAG: hypothetical protein R6U68_14550 [Desulfobacteraceae bacterium]